MLGAYLPGDPGLLAIHARALEAFARLVPVRPDLLPAIIQKVLALYDISCRRILWKGPRGSCTLPGRDRVCLNVYLAELREHRIGAPGR